MKLIGADWDRLLHEDLFMFGNVSKGCVCLFFASMFFFFFLNPGLCGTAQASWCNTLRYFEM